MWWTVFTEGANLLDMFSMLLGGAVALLPIDARDHLNASPKG